MIEKYRLMSQKHILLFHLPTVVLEQPNVHALSSYVFVLQQEGPFPLQHFRKDLSHSTNQLSNSLKLYLHPNIENSFINCRGFH